MISAEILEEGREKVAGGEVEDEAQRDGDGQRRQGMLQDRQQQQRARQALAGQTAQYQVFRNMKCYMKCNMKC